MASILPPEQLGGWPILSNIVPQRVLSAADSLDKLDDRNPTSRTLTAMRHVDKLYQHVLASAEMRCFHDVHCRLLAHAGESLARWCEAERAQLAAAEDKHPTTDGASHAFLAGVRCDERTRRCPSESQSAGVEVDTSLAANGGQVPSVAVAALTAVDEVTEQMASSAPARTQEVGNDTAVQPVTLDSHAPASPSASSSLDASETIQVASTVLAHRAGVHHTTAEVSANAFVPLREPAAPTATFTESSPTGPLLSSSSFAAPSTPPLRSSRSSTRSTPRQTSSANMQQPSHRTTLPTAAVTTTPGRVRSSAITTPRSIPSSSSTKIIAVPPWCSGPIVLDGLQVVPENRLGLTVTEVWDQMWGVSKQQLQRVWSVRGPDALLAAIIRSEEFDLETKHEHPSAADVAELRTNLEKFVFFSSEDEYQACFPAGVEHRTRQAMLGLLADPQQWLDAQLLYVYYAWCWQDRWDMRIYLISVDGAGARLTTFGEELANDDTSCTIIYESLAEPPAHYEAVSSKKARGHSRLKTTRPYREFADIFTRASRKLSDDGSNMLKRKATQPPSEEDTDSKRRQHEKGDAQQNEGKADRKKSADMSAGAQW